MIRQVSRKFFYASSLFVLVNGSTVSFAADPSDDSSAKESTNAVAKKFIPEGVTRRVGGYSPVRAVMDQEKEILDELPEENGELKFGWLEFGDKKWAFAIDHLEDGEQTLFVDSDGDGDLTNDPEPTWKSVSRGGQTMWNGNAVVEVQPGVEAAVNLYRFDPTDKRRKSLANTVLYYADFGYEYKFKLDDQEFEAFVSGAPNAKTRLGFDRNGDGKKSRNFETVTIGKPFNFTGTTYEIVLEDGSLELNKADEELPQLPLPPDLRIGKSALSFTATKMDGGEVSFPSDYKNKIVMLDFWATWCGPCIGEIPHMKEAYANWHDQGFDILGVSFDREGMEDKLVDFLEKNEQTWPQIYEGKGWNTSIGDQHDVSGIPFVLLVDGDSGEILANARQLRGSGLSDFIGKQLEKKLGDDFVPKQKEEETEDSASEESSEKEG